MLDIYSAPIPSPTFFEDSLAVTSPIVFKKPALPRLKMSNMGEPAFGGGHNVPHSAGPWTPTPYSAVSSFNLPAQYDSSLITPITMAPSPNISSRTAPPMRDRDIKSSPSTESPDYPLFGGDADDFGSRLSAAPMKQKDPSSHPARVPTSDSHYPTSPALFCTSPYYGAFGVSATPKTGRSAETTSPNMNPSPQNTSSSAMSADVQRSRHATPAQSPGQYRVHNTAPILIAPNPTTMRSATRPGEMPYRDGLPHGRHDSLTSMHSIPASINSSGAPPHQYSEQQIAPFPARRKRKASPVQLSGDVIYQGEINHEEQVLIELSNMENVPWKEIAKRFNEETGKAMKVPALQMRKKRLCERLRTWSNCEERALILSWEEYDRSKWDEIANGMLRHGVHPDNKWSKEAVQRKFNELIPPDERHEQHYALSRHAEQIYPGMKMEPRTPWPNYDEDAATLVGDLRNRTASDASSLHFQRHQHQQIMYVQQHPQQQHPNQHVVWEVKGGIYGES